MAAPWGSGGSIGCGDPMGRGHERKAPPDPEPPRRARASGSQWSLERKRALGCELDQDDVADLERLAASLAPASVEICGATRTSKAIETETRKQLLHIGGYVSSHLTEAWYSIFWLWVYIYVTVTFQVPIFSLAWSLAFEYSGLDLPEPFISIIDYAVAHVDAHFYVWFAVLFMLCHRVLCGRRVWTRFGTRSLVVVDCTVNYKLLRAFGSKLGALSFPFAAFKVTGQNGEDHFVHEMTHLAQSDVILLVGRPDARLCTLAATEGAASGISGAQEREVLGRDREQSHATCDCSLSLRYRLRRELTALGWRWDSSLGGPPRRSLGATTPERLDCRPAASRTMRPHAVHVGGGGGR